MYEMPEFCLTVTPHPELDLRAFVTDFQKPVGNIALPSRFQDLFSVESAAPLTTSDEVRLAVRNLFRHSGFKPTGRSKPASEYLIKAANDGKLSTINAAVDFCNIVSLHSGLPISVVDLEKVALPLRVDIAPDGSKYIFNASGQSIDIARLICLFDVEGPCANGVKDSHRTKTSDQTQRTLTIIWGTNQLLNRSEETLLWYRNLLEEIGANVEPVSIKA